MKADKTEASLIFLSKILRAERERERVKPLHLSSISLASSWGVDFVTYRVRRYICVRQVYFYRTIQSTLYRLEFPLHQLCIHSVDHVAPFLSPEEDLTFTHTHCHTHTHTVSQKTQLHSDTLTATRCHNRHNFTQTRRLAVVHCHNRHNFTHTLTVAQCHNRQSFLHILNDFLSFNWVSVTRDSFTQMHWLAVTTHIFIQTHWLIVTQNKTHLRIHALTDCWWEKCIL